MACNTIVADLTSVHATIYTALHKCILLSVLSPSLQNAVLFSISDSAYMIGLYLMQICGAYIPNNLQGNCAVLWETALLSEPQPHTIHHPNRTPQYSYGSGVCSGGMQQVPYNGESWLLCQEQIVERTRNVLIINNLTGYLMPNSLSYDGKKLVQAPLLTFAFSRSSWI